MNGLMIKALAFSAILIIATIAVVMSLNIDIFADSVNAITIGGAIVIATATSTVVVRYISKMKTDEATGDLVEDSWDGIGERTNELPSGWAYTFLAFFMWSMWYGFFGYPINAFSQIGEYNEAVLAYNKKFENTYKDADQKTLKAMGKSLYLVQCAQCHGNTADGLDGRAQDLSARMSKEQVLDVINNGSNKLGYPMGMMPPGMASGADAEAIAAYVAGGMKGEAPMMFVACTSCHGPDAKGMGGMSPDLTGYDETLVSHVLEHGKKGIIGRMPSFKTLVTPSQEKALAAYLQSLSN